MPTPNFTGQKPAKPGIEFLLDGYQIPKDINFRRLYDAIKILSSQIKELQKLQEILIPQQTVSFMNFESPGLISPENRLDTTEQVIKKTIVFDIMKRVSMRF